MGRRAARVERPDFDLVRFRLWGGWKIMRCAHASSLLPDLSLLCRPSPPPPAPPPPMCRHACLPLLLFCVCASSCASGIGVLAVGWRSSRALRFPLAAGPCGRAPRKLSRRCTFLGWLGGHGHVLDAGGGSAERHLLRAFSESSRSLPCPWPPSQPCQVQPWLTLHGALLLGPFRHR